MLSDKEIQDLFRQEAAERIDSLENVLLHLDTEGPAEVQAEAMDDLFRTLHTLKGSGNMAGFLNLGAFVHELETDLTTYKEGRQRPDAAFVQDALQVCDLLREMVKAPPEQEFGQGTARRFSKGAGTAPPEPTGFKLHLPDVAAEVPRAAEVPAPVAPPAAVVPLVISPRADLNWYIRLDKLDSLFRDGTSAAALLHSLAELGTTTVQADFSRVPSLGTLDPETCWLGWDIQLRTSAREEAIREIFAFLPAGASVVVSDKVLPPRKRTALAVRPQPVPAPRAAPPLTAPRPRTVPAAAPPSPAGPVHAHGLLCTLGDLRVLIPSEGIRACRPPGMKILRPLGVATIDGINETVIDLPVLFGIPCGDERVLVLLEHGTFRFSLAVEIFQDFMEGELHSGGIGLLRSEGSGGFVIGPDGEPIVVLDMAWFHTILDKGRKQG